MILDYKFLLFIIFIYFHGNVWGQISDSTSSITPTSIEDSLSLKDSLIQRSEFNINFFNQYTEPKVNIYKRDKLYFDKRDYRYTGNLVEYLPFGFLNDLGKLGQPNEINIYGLGNGNVTILNNNLVANNFFLNSIDMNKIQTEATSSILLQPLSRGFLYGFDNNAVTLNIISKDSLRTKPLTRIKYYQAPDEEGFIDALFTAKVLSNMALSFRLTNNSIDKTYSNTDYGSWKFNLRAIYRLKDSLNIKLDYYHTKLNTNLFGGIDVENNLNTNPYDIYPNESTVYYSDFSNTTRLNSISGSLYGNVLPSTFSKLKLNYQENKNFINFGSDSTKLEYDNTINSLDVIFENRLSEQNFESELIFGYQYLSVDEQQFNLNKNQNNLFLSGLFQYNALNKIVTPSVYAKWSNYNNNAYLGFGADLLIAPIKNFNLLLGTSHFEKPYSNIEVISLGNSNKQSYTTFFATLENVYGRFHNSISLIAISSKNSPIPQISKLENGLFNIDYNSTGSSRLLGINYSGDFTLWKIKFEANLNYFWNTKGNLSQNENNFSLKTGIYYIDTLYDGNLDLTTGITGMFVNRENYPIIDFMKMRSTNISNFNQKLTDNLPVINDQMKIDFFIAGRIQDRATIYFIYENIFDNTYYIVPYYPMPQGGLRIGVAWDLLD